MNNKTTDIIGKAGEDFAVKYLKKNKYTILNRNYRSKFGEIDIIAHNKTYIIFVEVKTRKYNSMTRPVESVTFAKQQRILKTAYCYMQSTNLNLQPRFDICEIFCCENKPVKINYIDNAFGQKGSFYAVF